MRPFFPWGHLDGGWGPRKRGASGCSVASVCDFFSSVSSDNLSQRPALLGAPTSWGIWGCSGGREGRREEGVGEEEGATGQGPQGSEGRARRVWQGQGEGGGSYSVLGRAPADFQLPWLARCSLTRVAPFCSVTQGGEILSGQEHVSMTGCGSPACP